jgi:hypothetical protein
MNDAARRLRAQKAYSTDPAYLERMAREEETRDPTNDATAEGGSAFARRDASTRSCRLPVPNDARTSGARGLLVVRRRTGDGAGQWFVGTGQ